MRFGKLLQQIRVDKNLSLHELARRASVTQPFLTMLEQGKRTPPPLDIIYRLANALGTDPMPLATRSLIERNWSDTLTLAQNAIKERCGTSLPDWFADLGDMEMDRALELLGTILSIRVDLIGERITIAFL